MIDKESKKIDDERTREIRRAISELKKQVSREKEIIKEMGSLLIRLNKVKSIEERRLVISHIISLKHSIKNIDNIITEILTKKKSAVRPLLPVAKSLLPMVPKKVEKHEEVVQKETKHKETKEEEKKRKEYEKRRKERIKKAIKRAEIERKKKQITPLEKESVKRLKKKGKTIVYARRKAPSLYVKTASRIFSKASISLSEGKMFKGLERDLVKANLQFIPINYLSVTLLTTLLSFIIGIFIFVFLLFFNINSENPFISQVEEDIFTRMISIFWVFIVLPLIAFLLMVFYPSAEKKSIERKIDQELPFATIHMSAISSSMIEPSKIFNIIISTKEYPNLEKEFTKLINQIHVYGYDLVSALKYISEHCPSRKLGELFNGLATTLNSGGDLPNFFDQRAQNLLFDYKLEREKHNKAAETFMDIYISVVVAAPMILMLLLMMMKISGLGVSFSTGMITLIMISAVTVINIVFMVFLQLKQPNE